ncbi:putative testis-expressed protein 13C [Galemys pyrenaicus]|uniref:Putative testis-expressed protein 13C n=1 Tax=Galemys pyrenaicus TaxID=202257 RepID=A0A8J6DIT6_GALPY|nr:putative testis-expressed protein 13C [Galemys pyrenaicus]
MAVEFGDRASGFRHIEVIRFINNEVLMNGGGPDFYLAFRTRPWNEIEDRLRAVVANPQVPRTLKRACAWSALALSVRVGARQREQQSCRIRQLLEQVEELEATSWALATELNWLREERQEAAARLRFMRATLQQVLNERNVLHWRLLQAERSAHSNPQLQVVLPEQGMDQFKAAAWPMAGEEQGKMVALGAHGMPHGDSQMAASSAVLYVPGPQGAWAQAGPSSLPMPVPPPFQFLAPFPGGVTYTTPLPSAVVESEGAAAAVPSPQIPALGIYPVSQCAPVSTQGIALQYVEGSYGQVKYSENLQEAYPLGDSSFYQEQGPVCPQGVVDTKNHTEEDQKKSQGTALPGDKESHSEKKCPVMPQETNVLGDSKSNKQEEGPESPQETSSQQGSESLDERKCPKQQQSPGQKVKQPNVKKVSDAQPDEKPATGCCPVDWICLWCKALNFSWRKACYKCKKVYMAARSGHLEPRQSL